MRPESVKRFPRPLPGRLATGGYVHLVATAAVWDLGSTSFQALVCEVSGCRKLVPVMRRRSLLNLGLAVGAEGSLPPERVTAAVSAAKRLRRAVDEARPEVVVALATAALRDAANGGEVVARLERVIGHDVRILDGAEEARLCFVGQRAGVWMPRDVPTLGIDLGGGSFELAVGDARSVLYASSAPVGATRMRGELGVGDVLGDKLRGEIGKRTSRALVGVTEALAPYGNVSRRVVLSGGTARALARLATAHTRHGAPAGSADVSQVELSAGQVHDMAGQLASLGLRQRLALPGMPPRRAPMIHVGASILDAIASALSIERFVVSEWGLREGALLDAFTRHPSSRGR